MTSVTETSSIIQCKGCKKDFKPNSILKHLSKSKLKNCVQYFSKDQLDSFKKTSKLASESKVKDWHLRNKEEVKSRKAKWYQENEDRIIAKQHEYRNGKGRDKILSRKKIQYHENKTKQSPKPHKRKLIDFTMADLEQDAAMDTDDEYNTKSYPNGNVNNSEKSSDTIFPNLGNIICLGCNKTFVHNIILKHISHSKKCKDKFKETEITALQNNAKLHKKEYFEKWKDDRQLMELLEDREEKVELAYAELEVEQYEWREKILEIDIKGFIHGPSNGTKIKEAILLLRQKGISKDTDSSLYKIEKEMSEIVKELKDEVCEEVWMDTGNWELDDAFELDNQIKSFYRPKEFFRDDRFVTKMFINLRNHVKQTLEEFGTVTMNRIKKIGTSAGIQDIFWELKLKHCKELDEKNPSGKEWRRKWWFRDPDESEKISKLFW